jgi:hypothetical protein
MVPQQYVNKEEKKYALLVSQKDKKIFKAWDPEEEYSIKYWKEKNLIDLEENVAFFTIYAVKSHKSCLGKEFQINLI